MKASYSFDVDDEVLKAQYDAHREAYQRIFAKLGVRYVIVSAVSGAMGGSASEEFLAESEIGEDTFVRCLQSGYAANVEAVVTAVPESPPIDGQPEAKVYDTPGTPTIATLVDWANTADLGREITAADTLKNVVLKVRQPGGDWELLVVGVPGDREVDEKRLAAALDPAEYALLDDADSPSIAFGEGLHRAKALLANGVRYLVDPRVVTARLTGADEPGKARGGPGRRPRLRRRRDHRGRGGATAIRHPTAQGRWSRPVASRWATSSSSAASTPTRSPRTCLAKTASRSA
jgi:prolyl-tRNA synthetase